MHTPAQLNAALAGRYEVERQVGQGGMATVFLARDLKHHRSVALKVLSSELAAVVGRERFLAEIEVTANLHHPHLLPLFDSGEVAGLLFYVMPYVEGESLRTRLEREKQLGMEDAVHIATAIGSALDYAHRHGVIHRDLKPENILMHERDPLVMDFGIALAVSNAGGTRVTQAGISLGTPQYMSPEQATGDRQIDARSDIYALGAVTYEMIAGEPPHTGSSLGAIMAKVIADRPQSLYELRDTVPEHVEAAVMRALAKIPADRFASAADFVSAITGAKALTLTTARRPAAVAAAGPVRQLPITPEVQPLVRRRTVGFAAAGVLVAALGGAIGARAMHREDPAPQGRFVITLPDSLNFYDAEYREVALARDGSRAVFYFATYPGPLYTRRTGQMHFDIIAGTDSARGMALAPTGKEVLYWVPATATDAPPVRLMKIPIEGGAPVKVADSATGIGQGSWGDNNLVIFRRDDHLVVVSSDASGERTLALPDTAKGQYALGWPEMLPGSKSALITILHGRAPLPDSQYLGTVNIADGKVTDLGVRGLTPHFANGHALFVRADGELFARPFDVNKGLFVGDARAIAKDVSVRGSHGLDFSLGFTDLAVSETGMIMFTDGGPYRLGGGGGARRSIIRRAGNHQTPDWLQVPQLGYQDLRASPDGSMLAFTITDTARANRQNIYVYTMATGQLRQLTRDGMSSHPVWSPDGAKVIFRVTDPSAKSIRQFFSAPWNESEKPTPLAGADGAESVEFPGPLGKYIAIVRGDSGVNDSPSVNSDIFIAPLDSPAAAIPFAAMGIRERAPRFSPNGKWLAYVGHEIPSTSGGAPTAQGILYVRPVPGPGAVIKVSLENGNTPIWSSDGRTLYYFAGGGASPFMAAHIVEIPEFKVTSTDIVFTRPAPGTGFGVPTSLWQTDVLPNGDVLYLTGAAPPTVSGPVSVGRGGLAAQAGLVDYRPNLIAIVNWLSAESAAKPRR